MKSTGTSLGATALSGLVIVLPVAILFLAVAEIWTLLHGMAASAGIELPLPPVVNTLLVVVLGVALVFLVCLLTGLFMRTGPGRRLADLVDTAVTEKIPVLGLVRNLTLSLAGTEDHLRPVEADVHGSGARMLGFLVETLADGRQVVFVPASPAVTVGHTYLVPPERVSPLPGSVASVVNALTQWGVGTRRIYDSPRD